MEAEVSHVATMDKRLNEMLLAGQRMEAFEQYYADDVEMQENAAEPTRGKAACREKQQDFLDSLEQFHGAYLEGSAVSGDTAYSEWVFEVTLKGGNRVRMEQVAARRWKDGKVAHERFYYDQG